MFQVYEVDENQKILRKICRIRNENEILDAVITAYSDGNYNGYESIDDKDITHCYRDDGTPFDLMTEKM